MVALSSMAVPTFFCLTLLLKKKTFYLFSVSVYVWARVELG